MGSKLWDGIKQNAILIVIGALFSLVPFYYQTTAQTQQNRQSLSEQQQQINTTLAKVQHLELQGAIDNTEIEQIKESLQRIEKKIDRLIESEK